MIILNGVLICKTCLTNQDEDSKIIFKLVIIFNIPCNIILKITNYYKPRETNLFILYNNVSQFCCQYRHGIKITLFWYLVAPKQNVFNPY